MAGFEDKRSPLAKALGERVPFRRLELTTGRLAGIPIAIRSLSAQQITDATREAVRYLSEAGWTDDHLFTELGESIFNMETCVQILARALIVPPGSDLVKHEEVTLLTSGPDQVRALLDPDEITLLDREFNAFQAERSPLSRATKWEEVQDLMEALGKGQVPSSRLSVFDDTSLRFIVTELAARLMSATRALSSPTSPSSAPSPTSSEPSASMPTTLQIDP